MQERQGILPELAQEPALPTTPSFYSSAPPELVTLASSLTPTSPVQVASPEAPVREALPPAATAVMARQASRRRDVRTRVSFTACIRQESSNEVIVECNHISKGGLSFPSRKPYAVGSSIEVAVPYSPGTPAIFVGACIRPVETIAPGSLFRYDVAYTRKNIGDPQLQRGL
jgi:PilZ domain